MNSEFDNLARSLAAVPWVAPGLRYCDEYPGDAVCADKCGRIVDLDAPWYMNGAPYLINTIMTSLLARGIKYVLTERPGSGCHLKLVNFPKGKHSEFSGESILVVFAKAATALSSPPKEPQS